MCYLHYLLFQVEKVAKQEAPKSSLSGMLNMGMKAVTKVVGEGEVQLNFERNNLRVRNNISLSPSM